VLLLTAAGCAAAGLGLALRGLRLGWVPGARRLAGAGAGAGAAMVLVPPMGSADHLVYAAYGRLAATGSSPYTSTAADLAAAGDPVGRAVEAPWQDTPSVYGPLATAQQWLAARIGGDDPRVIVFVTAVIGALAFAGAGVALLRAAGDDPAARARVALLWWLNPLVLYVGVNAAHADTVAVAFGIAALLAARRSPVGAGVLAGLACAVKVSLGLYVLALAWGLRGRPRAAAGAAGAAGAVLVAAYAPVGTDGFAQMRENARMVSLAMPLRLLVGPLESALGHDAGRRVVGLLGWLLMAGLAAVLWRVAARAGERSPVAGDAVTRDAVSVAALLAFAWVLTAPYSLPWYDLAVWAPLALLGASALDGILVARTALMVAAYTPGRVVALPGALDGLTRNLRGSVAPPAGIALIALAVRAGTRGPGIRGPRPVPGPGPGPGPDPGPPGPRPRPTPRAAPRP
jgi:hypothetical protein